MGCRQPSGQFVGDGIPAKIDSKHAIAHNKIMVIDNKVVLTGSFNFTKAAEENNAENLVVLHSEALAVIYAENRVLQPGMIQRK